MLQLAYNFRSCPALCVTMKPLHSVAVRWSVTIEVSMKLRSLTATESEAHLEPVVYVLLQK